MISSIISIWNKLKEFYIGYYEGWMDWHQQDFQEWWKEYQIWSRCPASKWSDSAYKSWCEARKCKIIDKCNWWRNDEN